MIGTSGVDTDLGRMTSDAPSNLVRRASVLAEKAVRGPGWARRVSSGHAA